MVGLSPRCVHNAGGGQIPKPQASIGGTEYSGAAWVTRVAKKIIHSVVSRVRWVIITGTSTRSFGTRSYKLSSNILLYARRHSTPTLMASS